ncbi:MAG: UTP--glucose-1-phosphate uridylyltransferase [Candidatus Brocadiae bacterium]|nr:UTP--glucose-1-phosphate uridylyltransferase [Candidatus Brocadiia bacterium]
MPSESSNDQEQIARRLRESGQEHALRWLDELDDAGRQKLLRQLAGLDLPELLEFKNLIETPPTDISFEHVEPAPVARLPLRKAERDIEEYVTCLGEDALAADRVAVLTVAGGQGTRLRYDHPKGMYPITPIRGKSLFQFFAEQILAARRRHGCGLPWLIMTSPTNDAETRDFFARNDFFGLGQDSVHFFPQRVNPILDGNGKLLRAEKDELLVGPDGHGGMFAALATSGLLNVLREGGWDLASYFQVDNPMVTVADARFLGHHLRWHADISCKVVPKRDPQEGLGLAVLKSGKPTVIEYTDVPEEIAAARFPSGQLLFPFGSIAVHTISVPFAERVAQEGALPWHVARKRYEILDELGHKALSPPAGCYKFERFIFDALSFADECAFVEVRRAAEFGPVKNAEGEDSPDAARRLMQQQWLEWLREAGASFSTPKDFSSPVIEISPLYAADAAELKERAQPGWAPSFPLLLEP